MDIANLWCHPRLVGSARSRVSSRSDSPFGNTRLRGRLATSPGSTEICVITKTTGDRLPMIQAGSVLDWLGLVMGVRGSV